MTRLLLILVAFVSLAAQDPGLPDGHFCMAGKPDATQPKGHECHCPLECVVDEYGNVTMVMRNCKAGRCHEKDCLCHADESCRPPSVSEQAKRSQRILANLLKECPMSVRAKVVCRGIEGNTVTFQTVFEPDAAKGNYILDSRI